MAGDLLSERVMHKLFSSLLDELTGIADDKPLVGVSTEDKVTNINDKSTASLLKNQYSEELFLHLSLFPNVKVNDVSFNFLALNFPPESRNSDSGMDQFDNSNSLGAMSSTDNILDPPPIF